MAKAKKSVTKGKKKILTLPQLNIKTLKIPVMGLTTILMNKISEEEIQKILNKLQGTATAGKEFLNIKKLAEQKIHKTLKGKVGFPVIAFKKAMEDMAKRIWKSGDKTIAGTTIRSAISMLDDSDGLVEINYDDFIIRKDFGRVGTNKSIGTIFIRPSFTNWKATVTMRYNANLISSEQILNVFIQSGLSIGVGSWRPDCSGIFGQFTTDPSRKIEEY